MIGERSMLQPPYGFPTSSGSESITSQPLYMNTLTWNNQYGYTYGTVYPCALGRTNTFQAHSYSLSM